MMKPYRIALSELRLFMLVWFGQLISVLGSALTAFALGVWVYERTGSATKFALIALFATLPGILASPFAGVIIDRMDRRRAMILCDLGSGTCTFSIALLLYFNLLEVWHIYIINGVKSVFTSSMAPAYTASTTMLVPKRHLARAGGMIQFSEAVGQIASPTLAVALISLINIWGVILTDFATFLFSIIVLAAAPLPKLKAPADPEIKRKSLLREAAYGWSYIIRRAGLLSLLIFFAINNFLTGFVFVLSTPLILSFTSVAALGTILSVGGSGWLIGSLTMSIWGGPRRRINGVLGCYFLVGTCIALMGVRPSAILIAIGLFFLSFSLPIILGSSQAIWQSKVALEVQGRVLATRRMIAWSSLPLSYLIAGPLAEYVFEPLLSSSGPLAGNIGQLIGVGKGRGIGLLYILLGSSIILIVIASYLYPRLRLVEDELPDMIADPAMAKG